MKNRIVLIALVLMFSNAARADRVGNGGDLCESRIQSIRDDLHQWIDNKGSARLQLPEGLTTEQYNTRMQQQMGRAKITCTTEPLLIGRAEKTCRNNVREDGTPYLECNVLRFMASSESDQYKLIHHEFAGLAGLENNIGEASNYQISNQITGYLENEVVKKLAVRSNYAQSGRAKVYKGPEGEVLTLIPLNNDTKMLIYAHNTYGMNTGKALVYDLYGDRAFYTVGFPSPQDRRNGTMIVFHFLDEKPEYNDFLSTKPQLRFRQIKLTYSEELSEKVDVALLISKAQDYIFPR
jgi:hypothetical protein